jgi:hypothetical protein
VLAAPFTIRIRKNLLPSLVEMHLAARAQEQLPIESFLGEVIEAAVADFRASKVRRDFRPAPAPEAVKGKQRKISAERLKVVLHLRDEVPIEVLAQRFGVGETTLRKMLKDHDGRPNTKDC